MNVALETADSSVHLSTKVYVNAETRSIVSLDRKHVGETLLWLPANPEKGESIVLIDNQTANVDTGAFMATCQGFQKFFHVHDSNRTFDAAYDLDTGVLLQAFFRREATMQALNISDLIADSMKLTATNINLGPREWLPEIVYALPLLLPLIGFLSILVFVLHRNRRRRQKKAIASSLRKKRT